MRSSAKPAMILLFSNTIVPYYNQKGQPDMWRRSYFSSSALDHKSISNAINAQSSFFVPCEVNQEAYIYVHPLLQTNPPLQ